jgi:hypothetical protein
MICSAVSHAREPKTSPQRLCVMRLQTVRILARPGYSSRTIGRYLHNALAQVLFRAFRKRPNGLAKTPSHHRSTSPHDLFPDHLRQTQAPGHVGLQSARQSDRGGYSEIVAESLSLRPSWTSPLHLACFTTSWRSSISSPLSAHYAKPHALSA